MNSKLLTTLAVGAVLLIGYLVVDSFTLSRAATAEPIRMKIVTNSSVTASLPENDTSFVKERTVYQLNLTPQNTVLLLGEVNDSAFLIAQEIQQKAKYNKELYLLIDSPGGSVFAGMDIITVIENSKVPVHTICLQGCFSMGAIIFEYGKLRYIVPRSVLMFHSASGSVQGPFYQMKTRLAFFDKVINKLDTEIASRVGIDPKQFIDSMPQELWLDGDEALERKFADRLAIVSLNVTSQDKAMVERISKIQPLKDKITINVR